MLRGTVYVHLAAVPVRKKNNVTKNIKRYSLMKTYLFDFDGTLVDSMPTYVDVMKRILDENILQFP